MKPRESYALGGSRGRGVPIISNWRPTFLVEQGNTEYEITPFEANATIEEYYDPDPKMFVARNADVGTQVVGTDLDTSELQFFQGSDGLHLVFAHGRHPNGSGSATFEINGLPAGHWSLRDGFQTVSKNPLQLAWSWSTWGAGGAYRGAFDGEFAVTILPREFDGIWEWNVVDADGTGHPLDLTEPVTIRTAEAPPPSPTSFVLEQAGNQYQLDALATGQSVEEFYSDGSTATGIEQTATSRLFFWNDPEEETELGPLDEVSLGIVNGETGGTPPVGFEFSGLPEDGEWVVQETDSDTYERTRAEWNLTSTTAKGGAYRNAATEDSQLHIAPMLDNPIQTDDIEVVVGGTSIPASHEWQHVRYVGTHRWRKWYTVEGFEPPVYVLALTTDVDLLDEEPPFEEAPPTYRFEEQGSDQRVVPQTDAHEPNDVYLVLKPNVGAQSELKLIAVGEDVPEDTQLVVDGSPVFPDLASAPRGAARMVDVFTNSVSQWEALTGDPDDPFVYHLDPTASATIEPGVLDAPLHDEISGKIGDLKLLINETENGAAEYIDDELTDDLHIAIEEFIEYIERHYEDVRGDPLEHFDEGLDRLIQTQKVTKAAVLEAAPAIRATVRYGMMGIVLSALSANRKIIEGIREADSSVGGSSLRRKLENDALSEIASTGREILYAQLGFDQLAHQGYRRIRDVEEWATDELADALDAGEKSQRIEVFDTAVGSGIPQAYDRGSDLGIIDPVESVVESIIDRLTEELYRLYLFGGLGGRLSLSTSTIGGTTGTFLDMLQIFTPFPFPIMGIDSAAQNRANDLRGQFDSRSLPWMEGRTERRQLSNGGVDVITERCESMVETFDVVDDALDVLSWAEFGALVGVVLVGGAEKIGIAGTLVKAGIVTSVLGLTVKILTLLGTVIITIAGASAIAGLGFMKLIEALHYRITFQTATHDIPTVPEA